MGSYLQEQGHSKITGLLTSHPSFNELSLMLGGISVIPLFFERMICRQFIGLQSGLSGELGCSEPFQAFSLVSASSEQFD